MPKILCRNCGGSGTVEERKAGKSPVDGKIEEVRRRVKCKVCKGKGRV